ncbi:MAG: MerR family transcriptional regulator [Jatrophihabitans sp.]|uniref:MerR family transcriptional regulator n=1 Tax=Jatrophihabitans sp. TaxID=1932789 RepID=UPI003F7F4871
MSSEDRDAVDTVDAASAAGELTIDELAARTGTTVRTVRFYASQGLLPPPTRRGRIAYYDSSHRMRLDLIRSLQEHGYTLAAIQRALERIPDDAPPATYGVQAAVLAPWLPDETESITRGDLDRRAGRAVTDEEVDYLVEVGALSRNDDGAFTVWTNMLGHALELMRLPVPTSVLHDSASLIGQHATAVAEGLTEIFIKAIWEPYRRGEMAHEEVVAMLTRLRPLAVQGLVSAFVQAADHAARRGLED